MSILVTMNIGLYGIKSCSTVRSARAWLDQHHVEYRFHDFRADGLSEERLTVWMEMSGWQTLLNRRGTTWRKLPLERRENIDEAAARILMLEQPTLIKRPVIEYTGGVLVGFDPERYEALFQGR